MEQLDQTVEKILATLHEMREEMAEIGIDARDLRNAVVDTLNRAEGPPDSWFAESVKWWDR